MDGGAGGSAALRILARILPPGLPCWNIIELTILMKPGAPAQKHKSLMSLLLFQIPWSPYTSNSLVFTLHSNQIKFSSRNHFSKPKYLVYGAHCFARGNVIPQITSHMADPAWLGPSLSQPGGNIKWCIGSCGLNKTSPAPLHCDVYQAWEWDCAVSLATGRNLPVKSYSDQDCAVIGTSQSIQTDWLTKSNSNVSLCGAIAVIFSSWRHIGANCSFLSLCRTVKKAQVVYWGRFCFS